MSINTIIFTGNCGADMELRATPSGHTVGTVGVALTSGWKPNEKTTWMNCTLWNERATKLAPYLVKGVSVTVQGEFSLDTWEKDGVKYSKPVVAVSDIQLHTKKDNSFEQKSDTIPKVTKNLPSAEVNFDDIPF